MQQSILHFDSSALETIKKLDLDWYNFDSSIAVQVDNVPSNWTNKQFIEHYELPYQQLIYIEAI